METLKYRCMDHLGTTKEEKCKPIHLELSKKCFKSKWYLQSRVLICILCVVVDGVVGVTRRRRSVCEQHSQHSLIRFINKLAAS
mmetsp:Transcript_6646/g.11610  ORF Transcript_6646/g.11610 Transcript_6646/m.11610 type:complete len:84 (+) Transcript_6646:1044-1295(+)